MSSDHPVRTCVACRARRPQAELVRLSLDERGRVVPDLQRGRAGRGAWVCPCRACVALVEARPRLLGRALKREPPPSAAAGLLAGLQAALLVEIHGLTRRAAAAGLLRSGALQVMAEAPACLALVRATDASALSVAAASARAEGAVLAEIGLDRAALGRLIGRGPRALLAVRGGTPGDELALRLRWRLALG